MFSGLFKKKSKPDVASTAAQPAPMRKPDAPQSQLTLAQAIEIGAHHHQAGRWADAEQVYRQVLDVEPSQFDALQLLGLLLHQRGQSEQGALLVAKAVSADSSNPAVCNNLGEIYRSMGRTEDAKSAYEKALACAPEFVEAHYNLGILLYEQGHIKEACACYKRALAIRPDFVAAHGRLGRAFAQQRKFEEARDCFKRVLALNPESPEALNNLGSAYRDLGQLDEAIASFEALIGLQPEFVVAHNNLGAVLEEKGERDRARACYEQAILLEPSSAEAYKNLGNLSRGEGKLDDAVAQLEHAIRLSPDFADARFELGMVRAEQGRFDEAHASFAMAASHNPEFAEARWDSVMALLPCVPETEEEVERARAEFASQLAALDTWFDAAREEQGFKAVGSLQPFLLAYQGADNRALLAQYGTLCCRLMRRWQERLGLSPRTASTHDRVRIGIVSAHIRNHSVWNAIVKGWFAHLDRTRFDLMVFALGSSSDHETSFAKSRSTYFAQGKKELRVWADLILAQQPDVLVYPEVGMDPMTLKLASLRLAPIQAASWGHPETTGLPTLDYYLSAEYLEPDDAQRGYTEKLVKLPNLGCSYQGIGTDDVDPGCSGLRIKGGLPLLVCPGTPFKYAPRHDRVFVEIAQRLGDCQFVFFTSHLAEPSARLQRRLRLAFAQAGLAFENYVTFVPMLPTPAFFGLLKRADVCLDTIGFSGFNTAMQAIECLLPVVTLEGRFMRGRLASGILRRIALSELVASSVEEYVDVAVRLVQDVGYRESVKRRIADSRTVLFDDVAPVRALEEFFLHALDRA